MGKSKEAKNAVLGEDQLVCTLTGTVRKASEKERTLQSVVSMLNEEYGFDLKDMERDWSATVEDAEGRPRRMKADLAVFAPDAEHVAERLERLCVVTDEKTRPDDRKKGVEATLERLQEGTGCEFGLWTNGGELLFKQYVEERDGEWRCDDISDFPARGQTLDDLERNGERAQPRKPANDSLVRTFRRCHDYIYGNEGMKKTAFWELLNLIFCKLYDEKRRFQLKDGETYRRRFWVGVKERNDEAGQKAVHARISKLFDELKGDPLFSEVFDGNERIGLSPRGLAYVAGELAKYSFLDATVDVKGTAYETIVSNTLKQEAGQFFTPRNAIRCMVEMMDPDETMRVLDPACGSGGFLVGVLDHVRRKIAHRIWPDLDEVELAAKFNDPAVVGKVRDYAENMLFGIDFDPDLKKAARMNMVMAGDGHANIFNANSLDYPNGDLLDVPKIGAAVEKSVAKRKDSATCDPSIAKDDARGKFDLVFTNPPFGAKVKVDRSIAERYELPGDAPEVLFIEQCRNFLKPGGRLAIVLPDGILGNPDMEAVRKWILREFRLLASVDLPVEMFLPQVGVQASLLFLRRKTEKEKLAAAGAPEDYDVFMAIAEAVGKNRRGEPIYRRDADGAEIFTEKTRKTLVRLADGSYKKIVKTVRDRDLDDDLPEIAKAYAKFLKERAK